MSTARTAALTAVALFLGLAALAPACSGLGSATAACTQKCDKQEECGDIDSVKAQQCRNQCDARADLADADLELCINKSDILSAYAECFGRACADYAACLNTLPGCAGAGYTSTGTYTGTGTGTGTSGGSFACDQTSSSYHVCVKYLDAGSSTVCPSGTTQVSACPTADLLGICTVTTGAVYYYGATGITASQAAQSCTGSGGTWSEA